MQGYFPLTQAQKRIWYTEQLYSGTSISNLSVLVKIKDQKGVQDTILISSMHETVRFFDSLRIKITVDQEGEPCQYQGRDEEFCVKRIPVTNQNSRTSALEWCQKEAQKPMTLYDHDLFSFAIWQINNEESWILLKVHHIIIDGISIVMIVNHLLDTYEQLVAKKKTEKIPIPSYLEYVHSETDYVELERFQKDKKFWKRPFKIFVKLPCLQVRKAIVPI